MRKISKILCFTLILTILLIGITAISATDLDNASEAQIVGDEVSDDGVTTSVQTDNIMEKQSKTVKNDEEYDGITVTQDNFPSYFDTNGNTKDTIISDSNLRFSGEINLNQNIIIDKALNITSDDAIIKLNTNTFTINNAGSNTNITGLNFYNTKVFVNNASNVVLNEIDVTAENQAIGWGTGVTSIRNASFNITIANSTFYTENNGGSSTLVLADANNCTIENNTITATGTVGNLLYLTTYNNDSIITVDSNSYNVIRNNTLTGPDTPASICWAIVLTGHNNTIDDNTVDYTGVGITTQAINVVDEYNYDHQISVNNTFTDNRINCRASVLTFENSTVIGNNFTGSVTIGADSTIENNNIPNAFTIPDNSTVQYNQFGNSVTMGCNTLFNYNNVTGTITINSENNTLSYNNLNDITYVNSNNNIINYSNLTDLGLYNQTTNNTIEYNVLGNIYLSLNDYNRISYNNLSSVYLFASSSYNNITYNNVDIISLDSGTAYNNATNNNISSYIYDGNEDSTNIVTPNSIASNDLNNDKNLKMDGEIEYQTIVITKDNYKTYFTAPPQQDGTVQLLALSGKVPRAHVILYFNDTIDNLTLVSIQPTVQNSVVVTANPDIVFRNIKFRISSVNKNVSIVNMSFVYDTEFDPNIVKNYNNAAFDYNNAGCNLTVDNVKFNFDVDLIYSEEADDYVPINIPHLIYFNGNTTLKNSDINISCYASQVDWEPGSSTHGKNSLLPIYKKAGNTTKFEVYNNTFFINTTETYGAYPTTYGLDIHSTARVIGNNITMIAGVGWSYAIHPTACSVYVAENIIDVTGINYTAGVGLENPKDCIVTNNTIYVNSSLQEQIYDGVSNEYCAYAIFLNDYLYMGGKLYDYEAASINNTITNNHIIGNAYNTYAIESFGGRDALVANNTIEIPNSNTAMAIGAIALNMTIADNNITINGTNVTGGTVDYLGAMTTGIYLAKGWDGAPNTVFGNNINSSKLGIYLGDEDNNIIENNTVYTDYENAIYLQKSNNNIVRYNYLESQELKGDSAVIDNKGTGNVIEDNLPQAIKEYSLNVDTTEFTVGQPNTITATIYWGDENSQEVAANISKGKVSFKVNGKALKDANGKVIYAKVINGTATIENYEVPESWTAEGSTIQAVFSGSSDVAKLSSQKEEITTLSQQPSITTEDVTTTVGGSVTLKATITAAAPVNNGKVVFKINGKTVKDANGKVIYAKVVDGQVSVEYTLPDEFKAGSYDLTAVYISSNYPRLEDNKKLTVN